MSLLGIHCSVKFDHLLKIGEKSKSALSKKMVNKVNKFNYDIHIYELS